jgi:tape measure domain-containing protein
MAGVDDAIVEMKFDNAAFERKLSETIRSLDKLRASLDFSNSQRALQNLSNAGRDLDRNMQFHQAKKSIDDLSTATKRFTMDQMGRSVEDISKKFLAMSTIAITALSQITSRAIDSALQIARAFTFGPIIDGFKEMETNMNSIQTILANTESKGTNLEQVSAALQKLNEYSDKTIYNFSQMAKNIGTFTAAGVDLDTSVNSIKGIANLAAVSGSSAEQASGAMYQLSQAIAAGSLKLIDWNSVVNAGMGGEVFKTALFETAKAAGTLTDVPVGQTFKEWEEANGSFRESLQDGWVTSDVLTTTLSTFTGDLSDAQLKAKGFTDAQIVNIKKMAKTATAAATEVKTFTQLMGTVKEAIATGFADSFKIIIGNFDEAKALFTGVNNAIGGFVGRMADARNKLLETWKGMGGREKLINGLKAAFHSLVIIVTTFTRAFRSVFPKKTGTDLFKMTWAFERFTERIRTLTAKYMPVIFRVFKTFFNGLEIGFTIMKEIGKLFLNLGKAIFGVAGQLGGAGSKVAFFMDKWNRILVEGGGIENFFKKLTDVLTKPIKVLGSITEAVLGFFGIFDKSEGAEKGLDRIGNRLDGVQRVSDRFKMIGEEIKKALDTAWSAISNWFQDLGQKMADEIGPGSFNKTVDLINVGLLGGILLAIRKFMNEGLKIDVGGGLLSKVTDALNGVTETLKSMEANVKADALLKIAGALAILTLSIVALSLIDSEALTASLTAMTLAFGQMIGVYFLIAQVGTTIGGIKFAIAAAGFLLLAVAMGILSASIKVLSTMSWEELAKGLAGVAGGIGIMVTSLNMLSANMSSVVRAGVSMLLIAIAMRILANAMQAFATMNWTEMGKGMAAFGGSMVVLVTSLNLLDAKEMVATGIGIIAIATGMRIMANAVEAFAAMSPKEIIRGLLGVAGALGIIVFMTNTMPMGGFLAIGAGMLLVSISMRIMASALQEIGSMDVDSLGKALLGLIVVMGVMVGAMLALSNPMVLVGAAAMVVMAGAFTILAAVIGTLGSLDTAALVKGIVAMAAAMLVMVGVAALVSSFTGALLALGAGMLLVGASFALFGLGLLLIGNGLKAIAEGGPKAVRSLIDALGEIVSGLPRMLGSIAVAFIEFVQEILEALPMLVDAFVVLVGHIIDGISGLLPKIGNLAQTLIVMLIDTAIKFVPRLVELGFTLITSILDGFEENTESIVESAVNIMITLAETLADNADRLIDAGIELLAQFVFGLQERMNEIVALGLMLLLSFIQGIVDNIMLVVDAGVNMIQQLLIGMAQGVLEIAATVTLIITTLITEFGNNAELIVAAGTEAIVSFLGGITNSTDLIAEAVTTFVTNLIAEIGEFAEELLAAGIRALSSFLDGLREGITFLAGKIARTGLAIASAIAEAIVMTARKAIDIMVRLMNGLADAIDSGAPRLHSAFKRLGLSIVEGLVTVLLGPAAMEKLKAAAREMSESFLGFLSGPIGFVLRSPSHKTQEIGKLVLAGLIVGLTDRKTMANVKASAIDTARRTTLAIEQAFDRLASITPVIEGISPVITPVLDLAEIHAGAKQIDSMMATASIGANVSVNRARALSVLSDSQNGSSDDGPSVVEQNVSFVQNNHSPKALSTGDIYRNTKSAIPKLKEELKIA